MEFYWVPDSELLLCENCIENCFEESRVTDLKPGESCDWCGRTGEAEE